MLKSIKEFEDSFVPASNLFQFPKQQSDRNKMVHDTKKSEKQRVRSKDYTNRLNVPEYNPLTGFVVLIGSEIAFSNL